MKLAPFLVAFVGIFTFGNSSLFSQVQHSSTFQTVFASDSLAGFDESVAKSMAISNGFYGLEFQTFMNQQKREFINAKYDIQPAQEYESFSIGNYSSPVNAGKYSSGSINNAPCNNEDFESGTLAGWSASVGTNNNSQNYPTTPTPITIGSQVTVVSTPLTDPVVGTIPNSPLGGTKVARINNTTIGTAAVVKIAQTFSVTPTNYLYDFAYWAVMQNATNHNCNQTPYMLVKIRNFANTLQGCPNFSIVAPSTGTNGCAGIGPTTWTLISGGIQTNNSWQKFSIDLTPYMSQNVTIEVIVAHCSLTGHYGYAYFDSNCNTMNLTVNGTQTLSMPSTTVYPQVLCGSNATLTAPSGLGPYAWFGPAGTFTNLSSQTVTTSIPGNYTLNMSPTGICNPPIQKVVNLQFVPPTTVTASPANLCSSGTNTSSTLSASGASNYTWMPGGSNLSNIVVSPTTTTIYTLTAQTGTCLGTYTLQVTVNPDPVITVLSSNFSVCPGQSATLTASGASSYAWNPGALSGSLVVVSPTVTTTYTTIGTSTAGCTGSAVTNINTSPPITLTLTPLSPTYNCAGTAVNIVAGGATSFTWLPGNLTSFFVSLSPTITTNYTVIGASGTCSNSANITLSVNPGPSITISPNPATVCPGNSTTLTATAPAAVGNFTWFAPVASNAPTVVVTNTIAGGYSVSAKDSPMGCVSTFTANPNLSPTPSITISPSNPTVCFGSSVTLTAGGAVNYTWLPGNSNAGSISVSPTVNTTYTLIGANAAGCTVQAVTTVTVNALPVINASSNPTAICAGSCATITPSGASTYTISGGAFVVCPLTSTNYTISGSDAAGCTSTPVVVSLNVNPSPTLSANASPSSICQGASSTLSVSGAISYTWSTGSNATSISVSPSVTTTYTVDGTSASGCTNSQTIQVSVTPIPIVSITPASASVCAGSSATLTASGAGSYTWIPGNLTTAAIVVTPSVNTTYTAIGATSGCTNQTSALITVAPIPTISAAASPSVICAGSCATLIPSGATSYTYSSGSSVVCPTVNSTYTITGSNAGGCIGNNVVVSVSVNPAPSLIASANPTAVCPGNSANLSASGATSYTWLPMNVTGANTSVTPTATTIYTVIGANSIGCTTSETVSVQFIPTPTITASATPTAICIGGSATLSASGASSFIWMPGSLSGANIFVTPTVSTTYTVTGTNSGCTGTNVVTLIVNPLPVLGINATPTAICSGNSATLNANGAATYTWNTGSNASSIVVSPLTTTTYSLLGTSAAGCVGNVTVITVPVNSLPNITANANPTVICSGGNSTLTASGGISYTWQPGNLTGNPVLVSPATLTTYTVSGSDANGCIGTAFVQVNISSPPTITISSSSGSICAGGSVTLSGSGGVSYTWQPGGLNSSNITVSPLSTTTYTLFGANAAGCIGQTTSSVLVVPIPSINANANPPSVCQGSSVNLLASGATTYTWLPIGLSGASQTVFPASSTTFTVFGSSSGCTGSSIVSVTVNTNPIVFGISTPSSICAGSSATLSAGGANNYTWMPGSLVGANITVNPSSSTNYTVTGSTLAGCSGTAVVALVVNPNPTLNAVAAPSSICLGQTTAITANGNASTYSWMPGSLSGSMVTVSPSVTTIYTVTGTLGSCTTLTTVTVFVNPLPNINLTATPATICIGSSSTLSATGALTYTWSTGATGNALIVSPVATTIYSVAGENAAGCIDTLTVNVTVNPIPSVSVTANSNPICSGNSATLTASGANSYSWNTGSTISSIIVNPASTTIYTLIGTNAVGCSSTTFYTLVVNPSPSINIVASSPSICAGFSVSLFATGATNYTWNPGNLAINPIVDSPSVTTVYSVSGTLGNCTDTQTIMITVVPLPSVSVVANPTAVCIGNTTTLTASGAVTYSWIPSLASGSSYTDSPITSTDYTVVGFDALGCPNYATVNVNVLPNPTVLATSSPSTICIGGSATLIASGATNYTWNPGNLNGSSVIVNPTSSTVYTLSGDNGACAGITTVSVTVNPLPVVSASANPTVICEGALVNLTATGAVNYTWNPSGLTGSVISDTPLISTTYTVSGEDANGCIGLSTIGVSVNPNPTLVIVATPTTVCVGGSVSLNASGALTYTWNNNQTTSVITDTPAITTVYSVSGTDGNGCVGSESVTVNVVPIPTISIAPANSSICIGSSATLTASGAINYTWLPGFTNGSVNVVNPSSAVTYTVLGDNGGLCSSSATTDVYVNPLPANVAASGLGTVSCASPNATLIGVCTDTNVSYSWVGPSGFSALTQTAIISFISGDFTLTVTDNVTGCSVTATVNIPNDNTIPIITPVVSGSITCAVNTVTITAANTTSNPAYSWVGPGGFTGTAQSETVSVGGNYTVTVTDLTSSCSSSAIVTVGTHTRVEATASITPASCDNGVSNNDGKINVLNFIATDKYDIVGGITYTGTATYATAVNIPTNGIITNNLANPSTTVAYTIRLFDAEGCFLDSTLYLIPVNCSFKTLGIAKAASVPSLNSDGTYDVAFKVVVKNYDTGTLNGITLTENLSNTFASVNGFTVVGPPLVSPQTSDLTVNSNFNGSSNTNLLQNSANMLNSGQADTVSFTVRVNTSLFFFNFKNTILGSALNNNNQTIVDSSNTGLNPDPDNDSNPYNNNIPTIISFTPGTFFGITKVGEIQSSADGSFDVSYTVTVHNLGNDTVRTVSLNDSLFNNTVKQPASYTIKSPPIMSSGTGLAANSAFDGENDIRLTLASESKLPPNTVSSISFVINVIPNKIESLSNSAYGSGLVAVNALNYQTVSDTSGNGANPDINSNGIWNEPEDNVPTVLLIPSLTQTLFIPEGFSPNGDNINDLFVIKGLPTTGDNSIVFFNRWGNKVYENSNYDNSWDGTSNAKGTLGKNKLPQGTYYYILDMKNSGIKPISGFITIQY